MTVAAEARSASEGYDRIALRFDADRKPKPWEWPFFETLAEELDRSSRVSIADAAAGIWVLLD